MYIYVRTLTHVQCSTWNISQICRPRPAAQEKGRAAARPNENKEIYRPKPADCMDCRDRSEVEAMPCMRSLNSSAFEAFSRAVS